MLKNRCSCEVIWHKYPLHRIDPPSHTSRRGAKRRRGETEETGKKARLQSSTRQAPEVVDAAPTAMKAQAKKRESQLNKRKLEAAKPNPENLGQISEILLRVRSDEAKRKAEQNEIAQRPNKTKCEREERMAEVQLKAFWTCYPLHPRPSRPEISKTGSLKRGELRMMER